MKLSNFTSQRYQNWMLGRNPLSRRKQKKKKKKGGENSRSRSFEIGCVVTADDKEIV
jgi:hypothetical protein